MSLQLAAKHLSNQGRGPDDTLVHMSRGEVKSLNDLAMAHGGHLTINPETGLPEAGFLTSMLPMIAGMALAPATGGASLGLTSAFQTAALVGAGSYLLNPKAGLMGGLMAGLGAYGGAGLAGGLEGLATSEAGSTAANEATLSSDIGLKEEIARNNAVVQQQAEQAAQAKAQTLESAKYLTDYGAPVNEFAQVGSGLPTSPGGIEVAAPTPTTAQPYTAAGEAEMRENLANQVGMKTSQANPYAVPLSKPIPTGLDAVYKGAESLVSNPTADKFKTVGGGSYMGLAKQGLAAAAPVASEGLKPDGLNAPKTQQKAQVVPHYKFSPGMVTPTPAAGATGTENTYFNPSYTALSDQESQQLYPGYPAAQAAGGGLMAFGAGGAADSYRTTPDDSLEAAYAKAEEKNDTATMRAIEREMEIRDTNKAGMTKGLSGMQGLAMGGLSNARYNLGGYSDGGRLLRGPGDGVSDSIPAVIGKKQPARLADGEFVVPARIVSEIGNGSTEAGARKLYAMMDRIQAARGKTVGKGKVAKNTRADKYLPA